MKKCPQCGGMYRNLGAHMRKHKITNEEREHVQETRLQEADAEEDTKPERPIDRFRTNRIVFGGGAGLIRK